jgi:hypothetical protein
VCLSILSLVGREEEITDRATTSTTLVVTGFCSEMAEQYVMRISKMYSCAADVTHDVISFHGSHDLRTHNSVLIKFVNREVYRNCQTIAIFNYTE